MGAVYKATDQKFKTTVALKEALFTEEHLRRQFEREARLLNQLRHAGLPKVIDHFTENGGQFLVMEFIPGIDLAEMLELRKADGLGPFPQNRVLRWADQLLDVLDYLHTQKTPIIHRDIKPANLKLTPKGKIILLDFGLAKGRADEMSTRPTDSALGFTFWYAPLEQIHAQGTDSRSDLYSLGATLYTLLTGKLPVDAPSRYNSIEDLEEPDPLPPIESLNPQVSLGVAAIIHQAMAIKRRERPVSAAEMRRALRQAVEDDERRSAEEDYLRAEIKREQLKEEKRKTAQEAARRAEEERQLKEAETRRKEDEEHRRKAELLRHEEEQRLAKEARHSEEARLAEETRLAEEARIIEENRLRANEEARLKLEAEQARLKLEAEETERQRTAKHEQKQIEDEETATESVTEEFPTVPVSILRRLSSEDSGERAAALSELSRVGGEDAFRQINAAFDDPVQTVRNAAARALLEFDDDHTTSFMRALREATPERRRSIKQALLALDNDASRNLIATLKVDHPEIFNPAAIRAAIGNSATVPAKTIRPNRNKYIKPVVAAVVVGTIIIASIIVWRLSNSEFNNRSFTEGQPVSNQQIPSPVSNSNEQSVSPTVESSVQSKNVNSENLRAQNSANLSNTSAMDESAQQAGQPPQLKRKSITSLRSLESAAGSSVTVTSDAPLNDYRAFRHGDRFYIVIPQADASHIQSGMRGRNFDDSRVQKVGDDAMLSFRMPPDVSPRVQQKFNRLEVVFAPRSNQNVSH